jgi:L-alanine-DL-glutamate epimerase-like enolase superfamily enzyme
MYRHSGGTAVRSHTTQGRSGAHALAIWSPYGQNLASPTWKVLGGYMRSDSEAVADAVQAGNPKAGTTTAQRRIRAMQIDVEFNR